MSKNVVFVGYIRKSYLDYFVEKGFTIGLIRDINNPDFCESSQVTSTEKKLDFVIPVAFNSQKHIQDSLKFVRLKKETLLICLFDRYLLGTAYIADALNLTQKRSLPIELARNATNKIFQRKVFKEKYPEISPEYRQIKNFHGAYMFSRKYGFPVVLKPANLSQSQLVNVCYNLEELITKGSYVLDKVAQVYKENHVYRVPQVGIEQYIKGRQYSVDSYIDLEGKIIHTPICTQTLGFDIGKNNFETVYSMYTDDLTQGQEKLIFDTVTKSIEAMGIFGNPTHTEVRLTDSGECKIIEVNVRTGAYRAEMLLESFGIDHVENVLNTILHLPVEVSTGLKKYSACPQFWSEKEGVLKKIKGIEEVKNLKSFKKYITNREVGDVVGPADMGHPKICIAILAHQDKQILVEDLEKIRDIVQFEVEENKTEEEN
ncbi:MAG: ATP-grasp domain-containing protein [bacterium]